MKKQILIIAILTIAAVLTTFSGCASKPKSPALIKYEADACKKTGNQPVFLYDKYGILEDVICRNPGQKKGE